MLAHNKNKLKKQTKIKFNRSEIKLVLLNEEELIREVRMRPVLYDRSLKGSRKSSRKQCWNDISKVMDTTEEDCRKRWRSLRDAFAKHYKAGQRADDTAANKQCKWKFYNQMLFLIPHLDGVNYDFDKVLDEFGDLSEDEQSINGERILDQNIRSIKDIKEDRVEDNEDLNSSAVSLQTTEFIRIPIENTSQSPTHINDNNAALSTAPNRHHHLCNNHNTSANNLTCGETSGDNTFFLDSDEKFLLSCAPALRRLTHRQNALVRLKIQQILFDIEFDKKNI